MTILEWFGVQLSNVPKETRFYEHSGPLFTRLPLMYHCVCCVCVWGLTCVNRHHHKTVGRHLISKNWFNAKYADCRYIIITTDRVCCVCIGKCSMFVMCQPALIHTCCKLFV